MYKNPAEWNRWQLESTIDFLGSIELDVMVASIHFRNWSACVSDHFQLWGNSLNEAYL